MRRNIKIAAFIFVSVSIAQVTSQDLDPDLLPAAPNRGSVYGGGEAAPAPGPARVSTGRDEELNNCTIVALSEPIIAAAESGRLIMGPKLGAELVADELVAKTDDTVARFQQRVSYFAYQAEKVKLDSDIQKRYAEKQADVAEAAYQDGKDANDKIKNAISPNALRKLRFDWEGAKLGIEKAGHDMEVTRAGAEVKLAEYEAADAMVKRHQIKSPVTGVVQEVLKHEGEWVTPGEPIAKLVQLDRVRVVGLISINRAATPGKLKGAAVTIEVPVERDADGKGTRYETFQSKIMHIGVNVTANDDYEIWAEVENNDDRVLWPGAPGVRMTLQLP